MFLNLFSRGDLEIVPEKYNYSPGEVIKGLVKLRLKKLTAAQKLSIWLIGQQTMTFVRPSTFTFGSRSTDNFPRAEKNTTNIFQFELPLDGVKDYDAGEYPFEINIPANVVSANANNSLAAMTGVASGVLKVASVLGGVPIGSQNVRVDWKLEAILNIPGALDMRKSVNLNIA